MENGVAWREPTICAVTNSALEDVPILTLPATVMLADVFVCQMVNVLKNAGLTCLRYKNKVNKLSRQLGLLP